MQDRAEALHAQGLSAMRDRQPARAIEFFSEAIQVDGSSARYFSNRGEAYRVSGDLVAAERDYRRAIEIDPNYPIAHYNLGIVLRGQERWDEAVNSYRRAIALKPDYVKAHYNLANLLRITMDYPAAEAAFREAIRLEPGYVEAWNNLGQLFAEQRRVSEAIEAYTHAIELKPDHASSHLNRSLLRLMRGEYELGWPEHEWRWKTPQLAASARQFPQPMWDGSELTGKTILMWAEQGLGDTIQFVRYAALVAARGAKRVIFECQPALATLLQTAPGIDELIPAGDSLPPFDVHAPTMSLPLLLRTTVQTIPADVPYLRAERAQTEAWDRRIAPHRRKLNVGLTWAGNPAHVHDRFRSAPLEQLRGLGGLPDVQYFSLQKGVTSNQIRAAAPELELIDLAPDLHDFTDTAAAICSLDVTVSVCTAVAHLAGALGGPVILMLFHAGEWRWLIDRDDTPWYPTMRIVQQQKPSDWPGVAQRVASMLAVR